MSLEKVKLLFINWTKNKIRHHIYDENKKVYFRKREIWWCALGKNIGCETDGKNELFERPVLILKKYSKETCFVLPLSTKIKATKPWYQAIIDTRKQRRSINITQGRTISVNRLLRKQESLDAVQYKKIINKFINQFK